MSFEKHPCFVLNMSESDLKGGERHFYRFKSFRLNVAERQLLHRSLPVPLTPKAFDVLALLVERSGHLVEREELLESVWADSFVEEQNITRIIHTLRRVLGEGGNGDRFIQTVAKKGYRFVADVTEVSEPDEPKQKNGNGKAAMIADESPVSSFLEIVNVVGPAPSGLFEASPRTSAVPKQKIRIMLFTVGFLTAAFLIVLLSFNFQSEPTNSPNKVTSIAVLPVRPVNATQRDEVYETGIAESLINTLGPMKGLIVRPLSATRQYSDVSHDPLAAGREQKVDYVLASNYQIADGRIRITSQLFNVATGQIDDTYKSERDAADLFAMQDAIADEIGGKLKALFGITATGIHAKRGTNNEEAYRLYLLGSALADKYTQEEVFKAIDYFEQAVRLDPNYARAYARLASAQMAVVGNRSGGADEQYPKAKVAIEKALAIDDDLAEGHSYLGQIKSNFEGDFAGAEREHKRAIELNPNSSIAHRLHALLLTNLGRHDEAIAESKTAIDLEPASVMNHLIFGRTLLFARHYDEAIAQLGRTVEIDPESFFAHQSLSVAYRFKGDYGRAFESLVKSRILAGEEPDETNLWKATYARSGWRGVLERQLAKAKANERNGKPDYSLLANLSSELGQREETFAYLEKALVQHGSLTMLKVHPRFDPLRDDPRYAELLRKTNLAP